MSTDSNSCSIFTLSKLISIFEPYAIIKIYLSSNFNSENVMIWVENLSPLIISSLNSKSYVLDLDKGTINTTEETNPINICIRSIESKSVCFIISKEYDPWKEQIITEEECFQKISKIIKTIYENGIITIGKDTSSIFDWLINKDETIKKAKNYVLWWNVNEENLIIN